MKIYEPLPDMATDVTPELEQRIKNAVRENNALHMGSMPVVFVDLEVKGIEKRHYKANSWTRNFWNHLAFLMTGTFSPSTTFGKGYINKKSHTGVNAAFTISDTLNNVGYNSAGALSLMFISYAAIDGIMVGRGTATESFDGNYLSSVIGSGTGDGLFNRIAPTHSTSVVYNEDNKTYTGLFTRTFVNSGSINIDVTETALVSSVGSAAGYMLERTLLPEPITVPPGFQLKVNYTIEFHYPEPELTE